MTGTLYLVSTPIGNINDISIRAIDILSSVDIILTEDTRVTSKLLKHHSVVAKSSLQSFNQINEDKKAPNIILALKDGKDIALVSDAGTPLISDPGYKFIKHARESNIKVEPVPGCCALIAAIISSGLPSDRFSFYGFLPRSATKRINGGTIGLDERKKHYLHAMDVLGGDYEEPEVDYNQTIRKGSRGPLVAEVQEKYENLLADIEEDGETSK